MSKRSILKTIMIFMILTGFSNSRTVFASEPIPGVVALNEASTAVSNKYGITGEIIKIAKVDKTLVILTRDGVFTIKEGKTRKYSISGTMSEETSFYQSGKEIYVSPVIQKNASGEEINVEIKVSLDNGNEEVTTNYNELYDKLNLRWTPNRIATFTDADNNRWITLYYDFSSPFSQIYRIDTAGKVRTIAGSDGFDYNSYQSYGGLSADTNKNVYYTYSAGSVNGTTTYVDRDGTKSKVISYVFRVDQKLKQKGFEVYGTLTDYAVSPNGDVWILSGSKKLIHFDKNAKKIATIALTSGKDVSIEPSGAVYVIDNNIVKLVSKGKLYTKFTLDSSHRFHELYMFSKDELITANENFFEMIRTTGRETVASDAAVKYRPRIVKDNKGNITIISKNTYTQEDIDLKLYQLGASGITYHNINKDLGDHTKAIGYDGEIYIPDIKGDKITINRIKNDMTTEKYAEVIAFLPLIDMQMDGKKNLYLLDNQTVYKLSPNKKLQAIDITTLKGGYSSQATEFIKDKYGNMYVKYFNTQLPGNKDYGLLEVNDLLKIKQVKVTSKESQVNLVFVTSKNEIAMIKQDEKGNNQMYLLDEKGKPVVNTSYDGTSYYNPGVISQIERIFKTADGSIFYDGYLDLRKKTKTKELFVWPIEQVVDNNSGTLFYTDYFNVYVYDKQLPKVSSASPGTNQIKVPVTGKVTLQLSEPVMKNDAFKNISLFNGATKVPINAILADNKVVISPKAKLKPKTKYTVKIPSKAIKDIAGNTLSGDYTLTFTTQ